MTVQLKRNDTKDTISYTVTNLDGSVVNLTGATVKFIMGKGKTLITNAAATIVSAAAGTVSYTLSESDTLVAGTFNAEFEVTFSTGKIKTYPSNGYIQVKIEANVDTDLSTYIEDNIAYRVSDIQVLKNSIQAQLDEFAKSATNEETSQARVEADGTTNTTLKARLDKKEAKFTTDIATLTTNLAQNLKKTYDFATTAGRNAYIPQFQKYANNPIFTNTKAGQGTIYFPCVLKVDGLIAAPLGKYYMWYSTDHEYGAGGISLAYSNDKQNWTVYASNPIYIDNVAGFQTETPSVIWNEDTNEFYMYYQNANVGYEQSTVLAKSTDGINWTRQGLAIDVPNTTEFVGDGHTGYFHVFKIQGRWFGYHLMGGKDYPHFGISYSDDGINWFTDPRPLGNGQNYTKNVDRRIEWNTSNVFMWNGQLWWLGQLSNFSSGAVPKDNEIAIAMLSKDLRTFISDPKVIISESQSWESSNIRASYVFVEDNVVYLYYQCDNKFGLAYTIN